MSLDLIQVFVGLGVITAVWRLNSSVAKLTAQMVIYVARTDDHEARIRKLEKPVDRPLRVR
jgi:cell division protein FtsB